jgi:hypothetical protein
MLSGTLAGALVGFLYFNFNPATIFLGDSGSLFLGFMLAGIGLLGSQKSPTVIAVAIPIVSLGLPVLDTALAVARRRLDDDVPVWAWHRSNVTLAACWEIRLPFLAPSGERIGSLVLWQDGRAYDVCLADVHAIAHDLRGVVEQKLLALWEPWHDDPDAVVAMAAAGDRRGAGERAVPLPRMSERGTLAIEKDVGAAGKGDAGANRSPRSSSGAFRQRSTPLS